MKTSRRTSIGLAPRHGLSGFGSPSAQRLVRAPNTVRQVAGGIALLLPIIALLLLLVPWQQSATGVGAVIAWAPANRQQTVEAPVAGRLVEWRVQEGQAVQAGEPLVLITDNDPDWLERLTAQLEAAHLALRATGEQLASYETKLAAAQASREQALAEYDAKLAGLVEKRSGEQAEEQVAQANAARVRALPPMTKSAAWPGSASPKGLRAWCSTPGTT